MVGERGREASCSKIWYINGVDVNDIILWRRFVGEIVWDRDSGVGNSGCCGVLREGNEG